MTPLYVEASYGVDDDIQRAGNRWEGWVDRSSIGRSSEPRAVTVDVGGRRLSTAVWGDGIPGFVLLHDGLGSIAQWRSVPAELARRTGRTVLAYDRAGHGESTPTPKGPWPPDWLHREAVVLGSLLDAVGARRATVVGHSDGGSIAAIHAASKGATCGPLALLAAHAWVEPVTVEAIAHLRARPDEVVGRLERFHARADLLFEAWSGAWVSEEFAPWDIRPDLHAITVPTLVLQGRRDEYATDAHAMEISAAIGDNAECHLLPGLGHLLHHEAPDSVIDLVAGFAVGDE